MPEIIVKLGDRVVQKYLLYRDQKMTIGRAPDNDIAIENPAVSRRHSSIQNINGRYILEDHQSANGSYVNGVRITKTELLDKDVITIGKHKLHFYNQEQAADEPAAAVATGGSGEVQHEVKAWLIGPGKSRDESNELKKVETKIGRAPDNDIRLSDWFISKHHAVIGRKSGTYVIRDLDSWRKTMVNGEIIQEATLNSGDEIHFGPKTSMRFEMEKSKAVASDGARQPVELGEAPPQSEAGAGGSLMDQINAEAYEAEMEAEAAANQYDGPPPPPEEMVSGGYDDEGESDESGSSYEEVLNAEDTDSEEIAPVQEDHEVETPSPEDAAPVVSYEEAEVSDDDGAAAEGDPEEIEMWEKALQNPSKIIRKQAARKLKKITGRDYDID